MAIGFLDHLKVIQAIPLSRSNDMETVKINFFLGLVFKAAGHVIGASFSLASSLHLPQLVTAAAAAVTSLAVQTATTLTHMNP